jgi:hypothetical protein
MTSLSDFLAPASKASMRSRLFSWARSRTSLSMTLVVTSSALEVLERRSATPLEVLHRLREVLARHADHQVRGLDDAVVTGGRLLLARRAETGVDHLLCRAPRLRDIAGLQAHLAGRDHRDGGCIHLPGAGSRRLHVSLVGERARRVVGIAVDVGGAAPGPAVDGG